MPRVSDILTNPEELHIFVSWFHKGTQPGYNGEELIPFLETCPTSVYYRFWTALQFALCRVCCVALYKFKCEPFQVKLPHGFVNLKKMIDIAEFRNCPSTLLVLESSLEKCLAYMKQKRIEADAADGDLCITLATTTMTMYMKSAIADIKSRRSISKKE
jgi:hypothetical protein